MGNDRSILTENGFVRIIDVTTAIEQERIEESEKFLEEVNRFMQSVIVFNRHAMSSKKSWVEYCKSNGMGYGLSTIDLPKGWKTRTFVDCVGRIVQVWDVQQFDGDFQQATFQPKFLNEKTLNTKTMVLERINKKSLGIFGQFIPKQPVEIINPEGILYPIDMEVLDRCTVYPREKEVSLEKKKDIFSRLLGQCLYIKFVEPSEERVLITNYCGDAGIPKVYVRPENIKILK